MGKKRWKGIIREEPDPKPGLLLFFTELASPQTLKQKARRGAASTSALTV
jgi:hypothetical protein